MPIVAGVRLSREHALELAAMLTRVGSDHTARLLLTAVTTNDQQFVALADDDRARILAVLGHPPPGLGELRGVLFDELNWRRESLA